MPGDDLRRVVFVLRDLGVGGAERVVVRLANYAAARGIESHVVALGTGGPLASDLATGVSLKELGASRIRGAVVPLARQLRHIRPDAVMTTLPQVSAVTVLGANLAGVGSRVVIREANDPRHEQPYARRLRPFVQPILGLAYRHADMVVAVSEGARQGVLDVYGVPSERTIAIPNASVDDTIQALARVELQDLWYHSLERRVVCVARLTTQKDHATLLHAFRLLPDDLNAGLVLLGSGPLESAIRNLIDNLKLQGKVRIVGGELNPFRWLRTADMLVLSSRWEGSPNVLVEAMALGVPVVATDCESGPREILLGGAFGELVPVGDAVALSIAMRRTLANPIDSGTLVERSQDFHIRRVGPQWLDALRPR